MEWQCASGIQWMAGIDTSAHYSLDLSSNNIAQINPLLNTDSSSPVNLQSEISSLTLRKTNAHQMLSTFVYKPKDTQDG
jgi:hypothetical protein